MYECLNDLENVHTTVLPKTLTELYERALYYVGKKHQRNADANRSAQETVKKLQLVAFNGMKGGKLVFEHELFDEQMKASGLLNHLSDSITTDQFCFTHLTIQEFLAARHVSETLTLAEIRTFIADHIKLPRWHLVLQFISGLLGKKIHEYPKKCKDCISTFVEGLEVFPDEDNSDCVSLGFNEVCVMKCLREVNDERIVKDVCETTTLDDVVKLVSKLNVNLLSNEWAAVTAVCEHMRKLAILDLDCEKTDCFSGVQRLLQRRCIEILTLGSRNKQDMDQVFSALTKVNCTLKDRHTCNKLTTLKLQYFCTTDEDLSNMSRFFVNEHGSHLEKLDLIGKQFRHCSQFLKMLKGECCPKLEELRLVFNPMLSEDAEILWDALTKGLPELTMLDVESCELTSQSITSLCKALQDERCQLTCLSLIDNKIGDDGARILFEEALGQEHCKLNELYLRKCALTDHCVPAMVKSLQNKRCQLTVLSLGQNEKIGDAGACMLFEEALGQEHCKLTELDLSVCALTDHCVPAMVKALQNERCQLTGLSLWSNKLDDDGACILFEEALGQEHCKLTTLDLGYCALTDNCVPAMVKALQDERCQLTYLSLKGNVIGDDRARMLFEKALGQEHCKLTKLDLSHCALTDQCVPALVETLQDERCRLTTLNLDGNDFSEDGEKLLRNVETYQTCKDRGLCISLS